MVFLFAEYTPGGLPTFMEALILTVVWRVGAGIIGGMPGRWWLADKLLRGLEYITLVRCDDDQADKKAKKKHGKKDKAKDGKEEVRCVTARAEISQGQAWRDCVLFDSLSGLCNTAVTFGSIVGVRLLWQAAVRAHAPKLAASPPSVGLTDLLAIGLGSVALLVTALCGYTTGGANDKGTFGFTSVWSAMLGMMAAFCVLFADDTVYPFVDFDLAPTHAELELARGVLQRREAALQPLTWPQRLLVAACPGLFAWKCCIVLVSGVMAFGAAPATWRFVRSHFQMQERQTLAMKETEERRSRVHLEYVLAKMNQQPCEVPASPLSLQLYAEWVETLFSGLSLLACFAHLMLYIAPAVGALGLSEAAVAEARVLAALGTVLLRLMMLRPYLQVYLLRDPTETHASFGGSAADEQDVIQRNAQRHYIALRLLARTASLLLAPVMLLLALSYLRLRLTPGPVFTDRWLADSIAEVGTKLTADELAFAVSPVPRGLFVRSVEWLCCWHAVLDAALVVICCTYHWGVIVLAALSRAWLSYRRADE